MTLTVLSWNLFHGRAVPSAGRSLRGEFAAALAGWPWDVALLQEVPPWWPRELAEATGAAEHHVLTSRNALAPLRRGVAERWPDLIRANGGGSNAILARDPAILAHRTRRLARWPERRWLQAVELEAGGGHSLWVGNLHASTPPGPRPRRDVALARETLLGWTAGAPCVLGGDLNLRQPAVPGFAHVAGHEVDHVWARGFESAGACELLERGPLSDHAPLRVTLRTLDGS